MVQAHDPNSTNSFSISPSLSNIPTANSQAMRVAIAGSGSFAKYFAEELPAAGLEVVILTRSRKPFFEGKPGILEQRITDYQSVSSLAGLLDDCDALISTISDSSHYIDIHLNMIEACKQTPKCKRFIPSEYGGNSKEVVEKPQMTNYGFISVKEALRAQSESSGLSSASVGS